MLKQLTMLVDLGISRSEEYFQTKSNDENKKKCQPNIDQYTPKHIYLTASSKFAMTFGSLGMSDTPNAIMYRRVVAAHYSMVS